MTTLLEHIGHVETVRPWYVAHWAIFQARVISAYERGDRAELNYLREVRGI